MALAMIVAACGAAEEGDVEPAAQEDEDEAPAQEAAGEPGEEEEAEAEAPAERRTLVMNGSGGEYEDLIRVHVLEPFAEEYNVEVIYEGAGTAAETYARVRATQGSPGFDIAKVTAPENIQGANDGLIVQLTEDDIPNLANVYPQTRELINDYGVVNEIQYGALLYNTDVFDEAPTSWDVLFEEEYCGEVITFDPTNLLGTYHLIQMALGRGGSQHDIEPGFDALLDLKDCLLAAPVGSGEAVPYLERGEASVLPYWSARSHFYVNEGLPYDFTVPEEGAVLNLASLLIPTGAENMDVAFDFIDYWLRPDVHANWVQAYTIGPGIPDLDLPEDFASRHVTTVDEMDQMIMPDFEHLIEHREGWIERWAREMS